MNKGLLGKTKRRGPVGVSWDDYPPGFGPIWVPFPESIIGTFITQILDFRNWVTYYGQSLNVATYRELFALYGYTYGGSGEIFSLPDMRARSVFGLDNIGGTDAGRLAAANTLGLTGGEELHTLTPGETPAHSHGAISTAGSGGGASVATWTVGGAGGANNANFAATGDGSTGPTALGGTAHNNMPPYILGNWIGKVR